ncbi:Tm-1-like ATP-binding domain-containing protein [Dyadobacter tibetensis]|uniref:Tm-1-like ATP-binding domain-containing protein n=1 Tax=Dyadobacter tibetensis TaxID=1211851 RepID=UPI000472D19D|nr:Tm-1-like ATP-binding domain-containing protein [Dyadobacter tibetensis]
MNDKKILILGCFDTKAVVFEYLLERLRSLGQEVLTLNTGVMEGTCHFQVDFTSEAVALAADNDLEGLRKLGDRGKAIEVMGKGASKLVAQLVAENRIKGAIGMGGGGGTYMALAAMQGIPLGIPKLCLTTLATKDLSRQIGDKDITLMPSVVDIAGLNPIIKAFVAQAAAAITGMSQAAVYPIPMQKSIAISMFGNTTKCVDRCTELLNAAGYEVYAFHATGVGGKTMELLIREGCFEAVLDITTTELADNLSGGICSAGPDRLLAAVEMGLPQVVVPGCLDMVNFGHLDTVPQQFRHRQLYSWAPDVTLMRTNEEENRVLGKEIVSKLSPNRAPTQITLPLRGVSQMDDVDGLFHNPSANQSLFDSIREGANERLQVVEVDAHINDASFAEHLVGQLLGLIALSRKGHV